MLGRLPGRIGARALAALVALTISGAPRLAVAVRTGAAPVCQCRAHGDGHRCACPVCAEQARRARRGAIGQLPPCHQKLALEALDEEERRATDDASVPCLKPTCGDDGAQATAPSSETFLQPSPVSLPVPTGAEPLAAASDDARELPAVPDVPPPIAGR